MKKLKFLLLIICIALVAYVALVYLQSGKPQVRIIFLVGEAYLENDSRPLRVGDAIPTGLSVKLAEGAKCFLQMPGGGVIKLSSNASVRLQEKDGRATLHLAEGTLAYTSDNPQDSAPQVSLPQTDLKVRSRDFQVTVEKKRSVLCVYEGEVDMASAQEKTTIKAREGGSLTPGQAPLVAKLLEATEIITPYTDLELDSPSLAVDCQPISGASAYQWECSANAAFSQIIWEQKANESQAKLRRPVSDGAYFLRVRAVNRQSMSGPPSPSRRFYYKLHGKLKKHIDFARNFYANAKYDHATEEAQHGLALCPDHVDLQKYLALSLLKQKSPDEASRTAAELKTSPWPEAKSALREITDELAREYPNHPALSNLR